MIGLAVIPHSAHWWLSRGFRFQLTRVTRCSYQECYWTGTGTGTRAGPGLAPCDMYGPVKEDE